VERDHPAGNQWYLLKKKERKKKKTTQSIWNQCAFKNHIHTYPGRESKRHRDRERERERERETEKQRDTGRHLNS
jgi:hypothetical protein